MDLGKLRIGYDRKNENIVAFIREEGKTQHEGFVVTNMVAAAVVDMITTTNRAFIAVGRESGQMIELLARPIRPTFRERAAAVVAKVRARYAKKEEK